jgi:hypothetical protein
MAQGHGQRPPIPVAGEPARAPATRSLQPRNTLLLDPEHANEHPDLPIRAA